MTDEELYEMILKGEAPDRIASKLGVSKREFNKQLDKKLEKSQQRAIKIFEDVAEQCSSYEECQVLLTLAAGFARRGAEEDIEELQALEEYNTIRVQELIEELLDKEESALNVVHLLGEALESLLFVQEYQEQLYRVAKKYLEADKETKKLRVITKDNK